MKNMALKSSKFPIINVMQAEAKEVFVEKIVSVVAMAPIARKGLNRQFY